MRNLLVSILVVASCSPAPAGQPERPAQVPDSAEWSEGGPKGGAWFEYQALEDPGLYRWTVYWHPSGEVQTTGIFASPGREELGGDLKFGTFDGKVIILMDGTLLTPIVN